jgi:hypothetical protein
VPDFGKYPKLLKIVYIIRTSWQTVFARSKNPKLEPCRDKNSQKWTPKKTPHFFTFFDFFGVFSEETQRKKTFFIEKNIHFFPALFRSFLIFLSVDFDTYFWKFKNIKQEPFGGKMLGFLQELSIEKRSKKRKKVVPVLFFDFFFVNFFENFMINFITFLCK